MTRRTTAGGSTYLYAVVPAGADHELGPIGLYESDVHVVQDGEVAAVVSDLPGTDRLRPERRHLAAHQGVLSRLVEDSDVVLPVSFGTVADNNEAVRNMLGRYRRDLVEQISRLRGRVEMEIRVSLDVSNAFEYCVSRHRELREVRDHVFDQKHEPSRDEKIDLGQLFERLIEEDREDYAKKLEKALKSYCAEMKRNKCRNEKEILRLSCLVDKKGQGSFEDAVNRAAEDFDDTLLFEHSGPFPPYNFIDIRLKV